MVQEDLDSLRSRLDSLTSADMASVKTLKESMQGMQLKMDAVWTQMHKLMVDNGESNSSGSAFIANPRCLEFLCFAQVYYFGLIASCP